MADAEALVARGGRPGRAGAVRPDDLHPGLRRAQARSTIGRQVVDEA